MTRISTLLFLCCFCLLTLCANAQTPSDPEVLYEKMTERMDNAQAYLFKGKVRITVPIDWTEARKSAKTKQMKEVVRKMSAQTGNALVAEGQFLCANRSPEQRLEMKFNSLIGSGKSKARQKTDEHLIYIEDGEKFYKTQIGSQMEVSSDEIGFHLVPDFSTINSLSYRLYPAVSINGKTGYPIEISEKDSDYPYRVICTIEPQTGQLLRTEFISTSKSKISLSFTMDSESLAPELNDAMFKPVLPGKKKKDSTPGSISFFVQGTRAGKK